MKTSQGLHQVETESYYSHSSVLTCKYRVSFVPICNTTIKTYFVYIE